MRFAKHTACLELFGQGLADTASRLGGLQSKMAPFVWRNFESQVPIIMGYFQANMVYIGQLVACYFGLLGFPGQL